MKKRLLITSSIITMLYLGCVDASILPYSFRNKMINSNNQVQQNKKNDSDYANFSGHWIGTCNDAPEEQEEITIELSESLSSIFWDNQETQIDGISTTSSMEDILANGTISHLRWSKDGQQLLGTSMGYFKDTHFSQSGFTTFVTKYSMALQNGRLQINYKTSTFVDGDPIMTNHISSCLYDKF